MMLTEVLLMATTVWYVPGWLRTQQMQAGVDWGEAVAAAEAGK